MNNTGTHRLGRICFLIVLAGMLALAWHNRFVQDDAFISYRYAQNLVDGHGLTWNVGEKPIEGYTNFLWVLLIAVGLKAGFSATATATAWGMLCYAFALWAIWRVSLRLFQGGVWSSLAVVLLCGTNYTFSCYATGGLETVLQMMLLWVSLAMVITLEDNPRPLRYGVLSTLLALGLMTRLDFALFAGLIGLYALWGIIRDARTAPKIGRYAMLILPGLILVGGWWIWKLLTYGTLLPNTFYAKVAGSSLLLVGVKYIYHFMASYRLFPLLLLLIIIPVVRQALTSWAWFLLLAIAGIWCFYVAKVGGCFMEFRMMVPIIPILMVWSVWFFMRSPHIRPLVGALCVPAIILGSAIHAKTYRCTSIGIEAMDDLVRENRKWEMIGRTLAEDIGTHSVTISTTAAGFIPYYSRLRTIDEHGLNDAYVARYGEQYSNKPGHQRQASADYLYRQRVNLTVDPWLTVKHNAPVDQWEVFVRRQCERYMIPGWKKRGWAEAWLIPIRDMDEDQVSFYIHEDPIVEKIAKEKKWTRVIIPLSDNASPAPIRVEP